MKQRIAGVDEAGRGALAGPVVAGAVILTSTAQENIFADSKTLSEKKRTQLFETIIQKYDWGIGVVSAQEIDDIGIKKATNKAMQKAVKALKEKPTKLLIDGRDKFTFDIPSLDIIKGDEKEQCISAASILAKVTRDQIMKEYDKEFPVFKFGNNKGYGCTEHLALLNKEVYCSLHRKTYNPLATYLRQRRLFC